MTRDRSLWWRSESHARVGCGVFLRCQETGTTFVPR